MDKKTLKQTALVSAMMLELTAVSHAATIVVDNKNCLLHDAISSANTDLDHSGCPAGSGADVLELPVDGNFLLTSLPEIYTEVTINANGSTLERDTNAGLFVILNVLNGGSLTLNDAIVTGGQADTTQNMGGGILVNNGQLKMYNSVVSGNTGGAVTIMSGVSSVIENSIIENNLGISGSTYYSGGLVVNGGQLDVNNSTITNNFTDSVMAGGAGIYVTDYSAAVTVNISNSTISGNTSAISGGGMASIGFSNGIELNVISSTITGNLTFGSGGGMYNNNGDITVSQSLLSGNSAVTSANQWKAEPGAFITVNAHNIFGESSTSGLEGLTQGATDIIPTEAIIDILDPSLTDNGGPTPTHSLVQDGPAVDAIAGGTCLLATDQAGKVRPIDGDADGTADCDVGAFENEYPDIIFADGFD